MAGAFGDSDAGYDVGSAYVFTRNEGVWAQRQKLRASDAAPDSNFGISVGLSGGSIVVGAFGDSASGYYSGAAYVFVKGPAGWTEQQKLTARDSAESLQFGYRVAISGNTVVVSAPGDARGTHTVGGAYVFERKGATWAEQQKIISGDIARDDNFGIAVAVYDGLLAVGAFGKDSAAVDSGAAYVYE